MTNAYKLTDAEIAVWIDMYRAERRAADYAENQVRLLMAERDSLKGRIKALVERWRTGCDRVRDPYVCADEIEAEMRRACEALAELDAEEVKPK